MGIFSRMMTVIRSNINALIGRAEDPKKMLDQLLVDMRQQLAQTKQDVAGAIADEKKLLKQVEREKKQAEDWERRAMLAVQEGRDDLARQALMRHQEHLQNAQQLHETWQAHKADIEQLKASLRELHEKIEEAKRKKNVLIARQKRVEAQGRIAETMDSVKDKGAFEAFERMEEKIEDMERQALAQQELAGELTGDSLAREFHALEYRGSTDQALIELKRKMGMLPAGDGDGDEPKQISAGNDEEEIAAAEIIEEEKDGGV